MNKSIQNKINTLLELKLSKGVQPSDLSQAIFEKEYFSTHIDKHDNGVILKLSYSDELKNDKKQIITMNYHYSLDGILQEIHESVGNQTMSIQWSRKSRYKSLVLEITLEMMTCGMESKISAFLQTLPEEIRSTISDSALKAA